MKTNSANPVKSKTKSEKSSPPKKESISPSSSSSKASTLTSRLQKKLIRLKERLVEYEDLIKRQQAEFDNFRKRIEREKQHQFEENFIEIMQKILPFMDDLERSLNVSAKERSNKSLMVHLKGLEMIYRSFEGFLDSYQIESTGEIGDRFDPQRHRAIQFEEDETSSEDVLSEVYQKGYVLKERVLRSATVKVKKGSRKLQSNNKSH